MLTCAEQCGDGEVAGSLAACRRDGSDARLKGRNPLFEYRRRRVGDA